MCYKGRDNVKLLLSAALAAEVDTYIGAQARSPEGDPARAKGLAGAQALHPLARGRMVFESDDLQALAALETALDSILWIEDLPGAVRVAAQRHLATVRDALPPKMHSR
jgi:hypothetical protein